MSDLRDAMDEHVTKPDPESFDKPGRADEGKPGIKTPEALPPGTRPPDPKKPGAKAPVRRRSSLVGTIVVLAVLVGLGFLIYRTLFEPKAPPARSGRTGAGGPPQPVGAATIGTSDVTVEVEALGTVTPLANITVKTQINGQLTQVGFTEGQIVQKGDFLAQIDPRPYQALLDQYQGQLAHDQGLLDQAKFDLIRYQTLLTENSIARQTAEDQKFIVQQDEGTVKADQGLIETEKVNLAFCHIVAPVTGRVGLRQADPGNYVQTTDTNGIVVLTQLQPISVVFSMPENIVPKVTDAAKTNPALVTEAYDQAGTAKLGDGKLSALDNVIDTTTGMLKARAIFDNPDEKLIPNQFVNIHLVTGLLRDAVTAPSAAIQRGSPGTFVYLIGAGDKVSIRKVAVGPSQGNMVAITSGLASGDHVVIDGADRLRDGMRVSIVPGSTAKQKDTTQNQQGSAPAGPGKP